MLIFLCKAYSQVDSSEATRFGSMNRSYQRMSKQGLVVWNGTSIEGGDRHCPRDTGTL